ncbi:MAG: MFS transporter [Gemmatimonadota bacterium]|nr:MFS transporter [Gemmatimonadota bacterium]MDH4347602.1 MFS transporter [Gemmatimonadota bacterium]MDH5283804.1 MFS transporter [Gemmatimonadota bacterium]
MTPPREGTSGLAPRRAALSILERANAGTPFEAALALGLDGLRDDDRRLAHELAAGVLRNRTDLDARLQPLVHRGWASVAPALRDILRIGAYQLTGLDRVPPHAAVSTTVALAREALGDPAARFANAILRGVSGRAAPPARETDLAAALAARASHPEWLVRRWLERFGEAETEALLQWNNTRPSLVLQPVRATLEDLQRRCQEAGFGARRAPFDAGLVVSASRPRDLPGFASGDFQVQDAAQALVGRFAAPPAGGLVYDACAAPGGKAIALGRLAGRVLATEVSRQRTRRLAENLRRAGSGREWAVVGSVLSPPCRPADLVLLDAPCLGTGTFSRHPDARWRVSSPALTHLALEQARMLDAAASVVRPGGWLVYATCSLEPEENEAQVTAFLDRRPAFRRDPPTGFPAELLSAAGDLALLPQRHGMDGAFAARLRSVPA